MSVHALLSHNCISVQIFCHDTQLSNVFSAGLLNIFIHQPLFILDAQIHIKPVRDTLLLEDDCSPDQSTTTWAAW